VADNIEEFTPLPSLKGLWGTRKYFAVGRNITRLKMRIDQGAKKERIFNYLGGSRGVCKILRKRRKGLW